MRETTTRRVIDSTGNRLARESSDTSIWRRASCQISVRLRARGDMHAEPFWFCREIVPTGDTSLGPSQLGELLIRKNVG